MFFVMDMPTMPEQFASQSAYVATYSGAPLSANGNESSDDSNTPICWGPFICLPQVINVPPTNPK